MRVGSEAPRWTSAQQLHRSGAALHTCPGPIFNTAPGSRLFSHFFNLKTSVLTCWSSASARLHCVIIKGTPQWDVVVLFGLIYDSGNTKMENGGD